MGDESPIPPASFFEDKKRGYKESFYFFGFCHIYLYYIIKKVSKTRANAVFPDAREGLEVKVLTRFQADLLVRYSLAIRF